MGCLAILTRCCGSLELLDTVGKYQEVGFEKLYQWTAKQCTDVDGEPSAQLHRAIAILRDRAEFYKYECPASCLHSFVSLTDLCGLVAIAKNVSRRLVDRFSCAASSWL